MMFCGNCGTQFDDNAVVCPVCGQPAVGNARENPANEWGSQTILYGDEQASDRGLYEYPLRQPEQATDKKGRPLRSSGYAAAALILAVIATLSCILPFISIPCALIGLIMSILGLRSECRSMSIVAMIINIVFLILGITVMIIALVYMDKYGFDLNHIFYFVENFFKNFVR